MAAKAQKQNTKAKEAKKAPKKKKALTPKVKVFIKSTYNNTIVTIADYDGNVLVQSSPGMVGFSGSKKSTAYAATKAAEDAVMKAQKYGVREAMVVIKGAGMGRQAAVKGLRSAGLSISSLSDFTPVPHGGVTPRKLPRA
ncbi:MAG TPA: 30S ribosomal protein S11 [Candidatus Dojkabacteria bacterium]|nr:30S ribosomal protein S11 [Candidatus Dojkabacteria bacterium]